MSYQRGGFEPKKRTRKKKISEKEGRKSNVKSIATSDQVLTRQKRAPKAATKLKGKGKNPPKKGLHIAQRCLIECESPEVMPDTEIK